MVKPKVAIIDFGVGNLLSVQRAFEQCGAAVTVSCQPDIIAKAECAVLPGVGAFSNGMKALGSLGLVPVIKELAAGGTPLLGICLGMQLLLDESEEHGLTKGLGIIPGRVTAVPKEGADGSVKIPHIGWNGLIRSKGAHWDNTLLERSKPGDAVYFVHSFQAEPLDPKMRVADCLYGGNCIPAVIGAANVYGCQFHPEKSGEKGLRIIESFLAMRC